MLATHNLTGDFIVSATKQKSLILDDDLPQSIENLIDLITIKIKKQPIEIVAKKLLPEIFDLRIKSLRWIINNKKIAKDFAATMNKEIAKNIQLAPYSDLAKTMAEVLYVVQKINIPLWTNSLKKDKEKSFDNITYHTMINALSLLTPTIDIQYQRKIINTSLVLEIGLILADLVLSNQIELGDKRIERELIPFLKKAITKYGAYAALLNIWKPPSYESSLINRIEILAASIRMNNKVYENRTSLKDFEQLLKA